MTADETAAAALRASLAAASDAVAANDPAALAVAQGQIRAIMARGAYAETVAAAAAGDAESAAAWLLLREFRATTRYDRPNADATLALQDLRQGAITPEQAVETIRADLLDTYQARLEATLNETAWGHAWRAGLEPGGGSRAGQRVLAAAGAGIRRTIGR